MSEILSDDQLIMTSMEIARILAKPHASIRHRIAKLVNKHPTLLWPLFTLSSFINDKGKAELQFLLNTDAINYVCVELGKDGHRLREALDAALEVATNT